MPKYFSNVGLNYFLIIQKSGIDRFLFSCLNLLVACFEELFIEKNIKILSELFDS